MDTYIYHPETIMAKSIKYQYVMWLIINEGTSTSHQFEFLQVTKDKPSLFFLYVIFPNYLFYTHPKLFLSLYRARARVCVYVCIYER